MGLLCFDNWFKFCLLCKCNSWIFLFVLLLVIIWLLGLVVIDYIGLEVVVKVCSGESLFFIFVYGCNDGSVFLYFFLIFGLGKFCFLLGIVVVLEDGESDGWGLVDGIWELIINDNIVIVIFF